MSWIGDFKLGNTFDTKFTTRQISGAPSTLSSSPVISNYVGNGTTELTAGITLTVDFDARTGLNNIRVVATSGNGYATATDNQLVITTGTVNSVSVVGEVVAEYSIENRRSDVQFWNGTQVATPATAGVPDINVKNYSNGTVAVAATGIPKVDIDTIKTNPAVNGGTITFPTNATLASTTNLTAGTVATVTNQLTAAQIATGIFQDTTAGDFTVAASVGKSIMNGVALGTGLTVNAVTGLTASNLDATITSRMATYTQPTGFLAANFTTGIPTTSNIKKNQALAKFQFLMTDSTNHAPATGKAVTVTRSIDGAALAAGTLSAVTELSNGLYGVDFGAGDLNGNVIILRATAAGCDDTFERIVTQP